MGYRGVLWGVVGCRWVISSTARDRINLVLLILSIGTESINFDHHLRCIVVYTSESARLIMALNETKQFTLKGNNITALSITNDHGLVQIELKFRPQNQNGK